MAIADQLVVMNGGKIEQVAAPLDLYRKPRTTFVATFIGDPPMSLLSGRMGFENTPRFEFGNFSLPLPPHLVALRPKLDSQNVILGIRSEAVRIGSAEKGLKAVVKSHEWVGRQQQIVVQVNENSIRFRTDETSPFHIGDAMALDIDLADALAFSTATGLSYHQ